MNAFDRLALDGGTPRLTADPVASWAQFTSDDDLEILRAARRSDPDRRVGDRGAQAPRGPVSTLERRWAAATGRREVVACASPVAAAHLLASGLELEAGDEVVTLAGAALAAPLVALGIGVVPVDVHPQTLQLDPAAVEAAVGGRTRAVIAVDLYGTTADYRALAEVAVANDLVIVEDGSASMGATYERRPVGSLGATSICTIPCDASGIALGAGALGAGALYATDDLEQGANARRSMLIDDPICIDMLDGDRTWACSVAGVSPLMGVAHPGSSVMPDLDAEIALGRLARLDEHVAARAANGHRLRRALEDIPGIWMPEPVRDATHTFSSFPIVVVPDELGLPESAAPALRDTLVDCMTAEGLWIEAARRKGDPQFGDRFPVLDDAHAGGLVIGRTRSPFTAPNGRAEMARIADCFAKILLDNVDRVRQLATERSAAPTFVSAVA